MYRRALAYAPLVPFAVAATAGIVADRYLEIPAASWLILAGAGLILWLAAIRRHDLVALGRPEEQP